MENVLWIRTIEEKSFDISSQVSHGVGRGINGACVRRIVLSDRSPMKAPLVWLGVLSVLFAFAIEAAPPVVSNVRASQITGTKNVEVLYDVTDPDGDSMTIAIQVSGDGGQSYTIPATALSGKRRSRHHFRNKSSNRLECGS
jgi:hypothetical protein